LACKIIIHFSILRNIAISMYFSSLYRFCALLTVMGFCANVFAQSTIQAKGNSQLPSSPMISQIDIAGVTVFKSEELWASAIARTQQRQTNGIESTCGAIKQIYRDAGYFLAEVFCKLNGAKLSVNVHEGKIRKIEISGVDEDMGKKIADIITNALGNGPVTLENFERGVMLAKDLSGLYLTTEVIASDQSGNDLLRVAAKFVKQRGSLSIDNLPRNFGQGIYGILTQEVYSTLTTGDMFRINVLPSTDFDGEWSGVFGTGTYRAPLNNDGLYGELTVGTGLTKTYYNGASQTPNNTFQKTNLASAVVGYPILRNAHEFLYTLSEINYYGLTGTNTGVSNTNTGIFRQFLTYSTNANDGSSTRASVTASAGTSGVQVLQTSPTQNLNDANFYSLRAGAGHITPLDKLISGLGLRLEASLQYTSNSLPTVEKYFLGDRTRLRGYGYAEVIGDSGYAATAEVAQYFHVGWSYLDSVSPFGFFDFGAVKQNTPVQGGFVNQANLASFGVGLQTNSKEKFAVRGWYGVPMKSIPNGTQAYSPAFWLQLTQSW
jgi:hemolysin activation/secretion protein